MLGLGSFVEKTKSPKPNLRRDYRWKDSASDIQTMLFANCVSSARKECCGRPRFCEGTPEAGTPEAARKNNTCSCIVQGMPLSTTRPVYVCFLLEFVAGRVKWRQPEIASYDEPAVQPAATCSCPQSSSFTLATPIAHCFRLAALHPLLHSSSTSLPPPTRLHQCPPGWQRMEPPQQTFLGPRRGRRKQHRQRSPPHPCPWGYPPCASTGPPSPGGVRGGVDCDDGGAPAGHVLRDFLQVREDDAAIVA